MRSAQLEIHGVRGSTTLWCNIGALVPDVALNYLYALEIRTQISESISPGQTEK